MAGLWSERCFLGNKARINRARLTAVTTINYTAVLPKIWGNRSYVNIWRR